MNFKIGKQYDSDNDFRRKARLHQSKYRAEILNTDYDDFGNYLTRIDAENGLNFYQGLNIFVEVKKRYPNYNRQLLANMLRSEHIPFNVFAPLIEHKELAKRVLNLFLNDIISEIKEIEIEFAPKPKEDYLDDRTAFDTYIEYIHIDKSIGILGFEVKYTENEYKLKTDSLEERHVNDPNSKYFHVSRRTNLFKSESISELPKDKYRQVWRNQLLGESMLIKPNSKFGHFVSIILYPSGNAHFKTVCKEYKEFLIPTNEQKFLGITFEDFFTTLENSAIGNKLKDWVTYLKKRYLVL